MDTSSPTDLTRVSQEDLNAELRRRNKIEEKRQQEERYQRYKVAVECVTQKLRADLIAILGDIELTDDDLGGIICAVEEYNETHP